MQTTYKELVENLLPAFKRLAAIQAQGGVMLHDKVAYGLNKNYDILQKLLQPHIVKENEVLKKHVICESKMGAIHYKTVGQGPATDFDYKKTSVDVKDGDGNVTGKQDSPEFHKNACSVEMEKLKDQEVEFEPWKVKEDEIAKVHNFPMDVYHALSNFEIISSLEVINKPTLVITK